VTVPWGDEWGAAEQFTTDTSLAGPEAWRFLVGQSATVACEAR